MDETQFANVTQQQACVAAAALSHRGIYDLPPQPADVNFCKTFVALLRSDRNLDFFVTAISFRRVTTDDPGIFVAVNTGKLIRSQSVCIFHLDKLE